MYWLAHELSGFLRQDSHTAPDAGGHVDDLLTGWWAYGCWDKHVNSLSNELAATTNGKTKILTSKLSGYTFVAALTTQRRGHLCATSPIDDLTYLWTTYKPNGTQTAHL